MIVERLKKSFNMAPILKISFFLQKDDISDRKFSSPKKAPVQMEILWTQTKVVSP